MTTETSDIKKMAAIMAAVEMYLQEEAAAQAGMVSGISETPAAPAPIAVKLWGISGRQTQMGNRQLMQMRTFK